MRKIRPTAGLACVVWDESVLGAYVLPLFWDGRAPTLEEQATGPQTNPIEMGNPDPESVAQHIAGIAGYRTRFRQAFGTDDVTPGRMAQAIAAYERTLAGVESLPPLASRLFTAA